MKRDETKLESAMARSELNRNTLAERANYWGIKKTNRIEVERGERNGRRKTDIYGRRNSYDGFHKRQSNINLGIGGGGTAPQPPPNFNDKNYTFYDNSLGIVKLFAIMIRIRSRETS